MKASRKWVLLTITLAIQGITLAFARAQKPGVPQEDPKDNPIKVTVTTAKAQELYDAKSFGGILKPKLPKKYFPEKAGRVTRIHTANNSYVKKGQLLLTITPKTTGFAYKNQVLKSPFSGYIQNFEPHIGEAISPSREIGSFFQPGQYTLTLHAPLYDYLELKKQRHLDVILNQSTPLQLTLKAKTQSGFPDVDPKSGFFPLTLTISCPKQKEKDNCRKYAIPGVLGKVLLKRNVRKNVALDPKFLDLHKKVAFIVTENNRIIQRKITLGQAFHDKIEVLEGIQPGDKVIVSHSERPKEGRLAQIEKAL